MKWFRFIYILFVMVAGMNWRSKIISGKINLLLLRVAEENDLNHQVKDVPSLLLPRVIYYILHVSSSQHGHESYYSDKKQQIGCHFHKVGTPLPRCLMSVHSRFWHYEWIILKRRRLNIKPWRKYVLNNLKMTFWGISLPPRRVESLDFYPDRWTEHPVNFKAYLLLNIEYECFCFFISTHL